MFSFLSYKGLIRRLRSLILRREVVIEGHCKMCGSCCRDIHVHHQRRWLSSEKQLEQLCRDEPEYSRFFISGESESGYLSLTCSLQGEDNLCTCHDSRLSLCRNYPSKSLYYRGGNLGPDCGFSFKAMTFRQYFRKLRGKQPRDFAEILRKETSQADTRKDSS